MFDSAFSECKDKAELQIFALFKWKEETLRDFAHIQTATLAPFLPFGSKTYKIKGFPFTHLHASFQVTRFSVSSGFQM